MTDSDVDKVLRALTEFRVDSAQRFGVLETEITALGGLPVAIEKLSGRVTALELQGASAGRFTWGDVFKVLAACASVAAIIGVVYAASGPTT